MQPFRTILLAALLVGSLTAFSGLTSANDQTPPTTTIAPDGIRGANGWFWSDVEVRLGCTDNLQCDKTQYSTDGVQFTNYGTPFPVAGEGVHAVYAFSSDTTGNHEAVQTLLVKIDETAPTAALTDPVAGSVNVNDAALPLPVALPYTVVIGDKTVRADAADALSGVDRVDFYVDGALRGTASAAPYQWLWPASQERAGGHLVEIAAVDVAGHVTSQGLNVVTVPTTPDGILATVPG